MKKGTVPFAVCALLFAGLCYSLDTASYTLVDQYSVNATQICNSTGPSCEDDCTLLDPGLHQYCGNCKNYLVCSNDTTEFGECAGDLEWDDVDKVCADQSSTCRECWVPADCTSTGPDCIRNCRNMPDGQYQYCENCTSYASCLNEIMTIEHCSLGLYWQDFEPKGCARESETCIECYDVVNCTSTGPSCVNNCTGLANGVYQSCWNCLGFFPCINQTGTLALCPVGRYWDDNRLGCYQESTTCQECAEEDKCWSTGEACISRCVGQEDGFYQACSNCSSYVECSGGAISYIPCSPDDWFYDADARTCFKESSTCQCDPVDEEEDGVAFHVGMSTYWEVPEHQITFDTIVVNMGGRFQQDKLFVAENTAIHFHSFSAGLYGETPAHCNLESDKINDKDHNTAILRDADNHDDVDQMFRNYLWQTQAEETTSYVTEGTLFSDRGLETSWSGFDLEDFADNVIAFYVARRSRWDIHDRINFTDIIVNVGGGYIIEASEFIAPVAGYYYCTYSVGQEEATTSRVALRYWPLHETYPQTEVEVWNSGTTHNNITMQSRSTIMWMPQYEAIWVTLMEGVAWSDADSRQTSWGCFYIDPKKAPLRAWAVHRDLSESGGYEQNPLEFPVVAVNEGNLWSSDTHIVTVDVTGYYYVEINIGVLPGIMVSVDVLKNEDPGDPNDVGEVLGSAFRRQTNHNGVDEVGKGMIVRLEVGDTIHVRKNSYTGVFSDEDLQTTFLGILLYESFI